MRAEYLSLKYQFDCLHPRRCRFQSPLLGLPIVKIWNPSKKLKPILKLETSTYIGTMVKCKNVKRILKYEMHLNISKGTLMFHHVCMIRDSKYVTKNIKCYNCGSLYLWLWGRMPKKISLKNDLAKSTSIRLELIGNTMDCFDVGQELHYIEALLCSYWKKSTRQKKWPV